MTLPRGRLVRAAEVSPEGAAGVARTVAVALKGAASATDTDERAVDRVVALSRLLAERLLGRELELAPDAIVALARGVLDEARSARRVRILVHPSHVDRLRSATGTFDPDGRVHSVAGDAELHPGDIRLETELGSVDARLETALDGLATHLRDALRT